MKVGAVGALALAALLTLAVSSASGKAFAAQVSCGQVITQDTKVDNDLIDCPGDGLVVGADDVTLDLHGHTIDGGGQGRGIAVGDQRTLIDGPDRVTVENGTVREFGDGIHLSGSAGSHVQNLTVSGNNRFW